jgi:MerR family transcriptional regulator, light-induced transcriptional regulator
VPEEPVLRIGELSRRSGVSSELLRAWERRYGLLRPARSGGGLRLYSERDFERVRAMQRHLASGLAAAQAAELAIRESEARPAAPVAGPLERDAVAMGEALERFDEPVAQSILDKLQATYTVDALLQAVVLPYLRTIGERWQREEVSVAQEHFASAVIRGRLLALARDWGQGVGPTALLACLPGEQHDIGLIAFGLALRVRGWRIVFLGGDTPIDMIEQVSGALAPRLIVLSSVTSRRVRPVLDRLGELAVSHQVALGGEGSRHAELGARGVRALRGDAIAEAARITESALIV